MHLFIQIFSHSTDPYFLSFLKSIHPSINLSLCLFSSIYFSTIYLYIHFSTYLSIYSFLNPSFNPSIRLFISQPIYPSICIQYFGRVFFSSIDADPLYTIRLAFLLILFQDTREKGGREKREKGGGNRE